MLKNKRLTINALILSFALFGCTAIANAECEGIFSSLLGTSKPMDTIEISAPDRFLYAVIDGSLAPQQFTQIIANIRIAVPGQPETTGRIKAFAKYKKRIDYAPDLSNDPPTAESREEDYTFSESALSDYLNLNSETATEIVFNFADDPIPAGITDLYLHVIFSANSGSTQGVTVFEGMKDLNEPQHILLVNSTDRVYLNHALYTAEEARNDPEVAGLLDDDQLDPYTDMDLGMAFYSDINPTSLHVAGLSMQAPGYGRFIILAGESDFNYHVQWSSLSRGHEDSGSSPMTGVVNQENSEGIFQNTQVVTFRGVRAHFVRWVCWNSPDADGLMSANWPSMASETPYTLSIWP